MTLPRSLRVHANQLDHHVLEWSPSLEERPRGTAVLVHGYMDAAATWGRVAPQLAAAGHRVLALDMRGYGEGARVPKGAYYHFADYVFDLADVVDALAPGEPVTLVGHSMGGTITTLFAGTYPERVARMANLEGLGPPDNDWSIGPVRMKAWIDGVRAQRSRGDRTVTMSREDALTRLAANHPNVPRAVLEGCVPHLTRQVGDGVAWTFDPLHRTTSPVPFFAKLFVEFAKKVTCPVLFVSGGPTGFHPVDEPERLAAFAHLEQKTLETTNHMMHWTEPDALATLLVTFSTRAKS